MKQRNIFIATCAAAILAATGTALAQNGTGGNMGTGPDGQASGVYPSPTQGVEKAPSITGESPPMDPSKPDQAKRMHEAQKPPAAASGAETSGQ
jgi:hypothetical protein